MRRIEKPKLQVIESENGTDFQNLFNAAMDKLAQYDPEYVFREFPDKHVAYITWIKRETITETVEDEFHLQGIKRQCKDCPYFDADPDGRVITGDCPELERKVRRDKPACELYYKRLKDGII